MIRTDSAGFMYGLLRKALLTAALLIALSVSAGCAGADKEQASAEEWHYIQFDNTQKVVYDAFRKACADPFSDEPVGFKDENGEVVRVSVQETDTVYQGFLYDHPECFWLGQTYRYRLSEDEDGAGRADAAAVLSVASSLKEQEAMKREFDAAAREMLDGIPDRGRDGKRALEIYERLIQGADYTEEALYDPSMKSEHTAYGAIVSRGAACDGFALAYKYLLNAKGIPCIVIPGMSDGQPHVWCTVFWDGQWHEADPTWDACGQESGTVQYFDLTTEEMNRDHTREDSEIAGAVPVSEE